MTKEKFIQLVIEWNQNSRYQENIIKDISWHGERNIRYGSDSLWLDIEEYRNQNIIAIRYEKIAAGGVIWDTDYVMNFNEMKMSILLDRSYLEDASTDDFSYSTPNFITLLINNGYIKDDGDLPIHYKPVFIKSDNLKLLVDVINGDVKYQLPVVYVSKTCCGNDPVDIYQLAKRLKGLAHVLVEEGTYLNSQIRYLCNDNNEFNGAIGIYYPKSSFGHRKYMYRNYEGSKSKLMNKIVNSVINYYNIQKINMLYTWQGVNNALLRDRLNSKVSELSETNELIDYVDNDNDQLKKQVEELTRANEALTYENQGLRSKLNNSDNIPILFLGEEEDFFKDEIKVILLDALELALKNYKPKSRRADVITDIIKRNNCPHQTANRHNEIKNLLKGYKSLSTQIKNTLYDMGLRLSEDGKHCKFTYYGDERYTATLAKTPSDTRSGLNIALEIINTMF